MKLASFRFDGNATYGVATSDDKLIDIKATAGDDAPHSLLELIESGQSGLELVTEIVGDLKNAVLVVPDRVAWLPPVVRPGKICGVAMNNSASNERKISAPDHPAFFLKPASCPSSVSRLGGGHWPIRAEPLAVGAVLVLGLDRSPESRRHTLWAHQEPLKLRLCAQVAMLGE